MNQQHEQNKHKDSMVIDLKKQDPVSIAKQPEQVIPVREPLFNSKVPVQKSVNEKILNGVSSTWHEWKKSPLFMAVFLALALGIVGGTSTFWLTHRVQLSPQTVKTLTPAATSTSQAAEETTVATLVSRVGRLMALPANEEPTIALVKDVESLRSQAFFNNARNGDFVLMYAKSRKAILYDAVTDKIIEVAPITDQ